jgi:hypothetical protein
MSDMDKDMTLWCLVEGEDAAFSVVTSPTTFIDELKNIIKREPFKGSMHQTSNSGRCVISSDLFRLYGRHHSTRRSMWTLKGYMML